MNGFLRTLKFPDQLDIDPEILRGIKASFPVVLGFIPFALVLGAQAVSKGFTIFSVPLMTGLNFGGGSEFTAVNLWTTPPNLALIVLMSILVNSRHILMGAALVPHVNHLPKRKIIPALFFMCDESWAMSLTDAKNGKSFSLAYYLGLAICLYLTWIIFTTIGAVIGPKIGDLERYGFDMAFTAVFLVLLKGMWKNFNTALPWLVSLIFAGLTYIVIPGAWYVLTGALAGLIFSWFSGGKND
ncbi:AzlC family ABC transporter permease [Acinetobacter baumannii]|uniref:AzlC family ABC transporter permease n=1 Tax=Acinetobacter baumannii TaxID=470 RepID=UPI00028D3C09|nr:AzlC family ABC transporter permease [Acinetobacter baumannii]EHU1441378.1 AzlC family ABC transporter permease [Acinetobacter baumannii]EHU1809198.1 AzlC family ABC transporter permease [Acinetobacter baumannii]EHU2698586.1 AzlC family ABC transporter permease [Acinetobacter baumannii]EKL57158.1 putative azaleucine resistance protein AzlC [Acinetobacter baumannii OIFC110]MDC4449063.1 AzlC family ABC transporter permease [Acinetobacter baumannii]